MARAAKTEAKRDGKALRSQRNSPGDTVVSVAASRAKAEFLSLIDQVHVDNRAVLISRRGKLIAQIAPLKKHMSGDPFGCLKGTVQTHGDVVAPEPDAWDAMA